MAPSLSHQSTVSALVVILDLSLGLSAPLLKLDRFERLVANILSTTLEAEEILGTLNVDLRNLLSFHVPAARENHRQHLSTLSDQLERQSSTLKRLQEVTTNVASRVERSRIRALNAACPLFSLPPEIVRYIQSLAYDAGETPRDRISRVLSHISSSWREVALDHTILWSELKQLRCHPEAFQELLRRSGQREVTLHIESVHGNEANDRARIIRDRRPISDKSPIFPHASSRLRELILAVHEVHHLQQCADENGIFPALFELYMVIITIPDGDGMAYDLHPAKIFKPTPIAMPKLERLRLRSSHLPNLLEIGEQMTHLHLALCRLHMPQFTDMLRACRNLEELRLEHNTAEPMDFTEAPSWELTKLCSLRIQYCEAGVLHHIFFRLCLPELRHFYVTFLPVTQNYASDDILQADILGDIDVTPLSYFHVFESLPTFVSKADADEDR